MNPPQQFIIAKSGGGDGDTRDGNGGDTSVKLIGRERHVDALLDAYYRCNSTHKAPIVECDENDATSTSDSDHAVDSTIGASSSSQPPLQEQHHEVMKEIVLVTGQSGSGKTVLARSALQRQVEEERGYFCYGKCDQNQIMVQPYRPFVEAMNQLVDTVLKRDDIGEEISRMEDAIEFATTDSNVSLLTDMFPSFRRIVYPDDDSQDYGDDSQDAQSPNQQQRKSQQDGGGGGPKPSSPSEDGATPGIVAYCKFLEVFCSIEHPVVLLLDDWQWIDPSSLQLINSLFSSSTTNESRISGLMVVGTCRTDEVSIHDPLSKVLRTLEQTHNVRITDVQVHNLTVRQVQQLIQQQLLLQLPITTSSVGGGAATAPPQDASTAASKPQDMTIKSKFAQLARIVHHLTNGNPFHVQQSVRGLYDAKLLYHDGTGWNFRERDIRNVEDSLKCNSMLESKLRDLSNVSTYVHDTLIIASCLGSTFSSYHLYVATKSIITSTLEESTEFNTSSSFSLPATSSPTSIFEQLEYALNLLVQSGVLTLVKFSGSGNTNALSSTNNHSIRNSSNQHHYHRSWFQWTHDRFQQEAYMMIPERYRKQYNVGIGRQLLYNLSQEEIYENPFLITNLFLHDLNLIRSQNERTSIARLFNVAGIKAAKSSAFASAASFFQTGISLLPAGKNYDGDINRSQRWQEQYTLSLALYNGAIEMESCNGRYDVADQLFEEVIHHALTLQDQIRAYNSKISSLSARHLDRDAVELGLQVLRGLGETFPKQNPSKLHTTAAVLRAIWKIRGKSISSILALKPMRLWNKIAALRIMQLIFASGVRIGSDHVVLLITRSIDLTLRYGLSPIAEPVFSLFGMILGTVAVGFVDDAIRCGVISQKICEKYIESHRNGRSEWVCRCSTVNYGYIQAWQMRWPSALHLLTAGMRPGLVVGDVEVAYINATLYNLSAIFASQELLQDHINTMDEHYEIFSNLHQSMYFLRLIRELAIRFVGQSQLAVEGGSVNSIPFREFCDNQIADDEAKAGGRSDPALLVISLSCQLFYALYNGDLSHGKDATEHIRKLHYDTMYGAIIVLQIQFLIGMIEVVSAREAQMKRKTKRVHGRRPGQAVLKKLRDCANKMKMPQNILNKIYLLEAEQLALRGDKDNALWKFRASSKFAREMNVIHEEALAYERAAIALDEWGEEAEALASIKKAMVLYKKWGSPGKVAQLEKLPFVTRCISSTSVGNSCQFEYGRAESQMLAGDNAIVPQVASN